MTLGRDIKKDLLVTSTSTVPLLSDLYIRALKLVGDVRYYSLEARNDDRLYNTISTGRSHVTSKDRRQCENYAVMH